MSSREERIARLKSLGIDTDGLIERVSALVKVHTVEKHEDPKNPEKVTGLIKPDADHVRGIVQKVVSQSDIAPVEKFVENELVELLS